MENCCCCRVRTACLIFGGLYLLGAVWGVGDEISTIVTTVNKTPEQTQQEVVDIQQAFNEIGVKLTQDQIFNFLDIGFYLTIGNLFLSVFLIVFSGLMLYGVHNSKSSFLVPGLIFYPVDTIIRIIFVAVHVQNLGFTHPLSILFNITCLVGIVLDFFVWLCVFSHRQQIQNQLVNHEEWEGNEKFAM